MPTLSQWFLRVALINLLLGFTIGALMLANKGVLLHPSLWRLLPLHIELLLMGWTLQLAFGVAFWIVPRFWGEARRGDERGAYVAFCLLNVGVWCVIGGSWFGLSELMLVGRLLEAGAVCAFAIHIWPRIVGREG
jgi:cbb3-type cytochrome oxidase subunit 1